MSKPQKVKTMSTQAPKPAETQAPAQQDQGNTATEQNLGVGGANQNPDSEQYGAPAVGAGQDGTGATDADDQSTADAGTDKTVQDKTEPSADGASQEAPKDEADATSAPVLVPEPTEASTAADEPELSEVDKAIAASIDSPNRYLSMLGKVLGEYRTAMGETKPTDPTVIEEQNAQLWAVLRQAVKSGDAFRDCMQFLLMVFRENRDGAFNLRMLLRGIDNVSSRLNADHRAGYTGLVTLLESAAGLNNPKDVSRHINLTKALESTVFTEDARQRVIGYFSV